MKHTHVKLTAEIIDLPKNPGERYGLLILEKKKDKLIAPWIIYLREEDFEVVG